MIPHPLSGLGPTTTPRTAFGAALRFARETRGVTQGQLARRTMFDESYISRLESGSRQPSRATVLKLATCLYLDGSTRDRLLRAAGYLTVADYRRYVEQEASS